MKNKSTWLLLLLLIGFILFSWYMLQKPDKISKIMADRDFAVQDIKSIQKIFLAGRDKKTITLEKVNGIWILNNKYKAASNPVKNLLQAIKDIRLQSIPPRSHEKSIMEGMALYGIKVELYASGDELLKTYYVGGTTQQEYGTYYYMEHGSQAYIMEIPHFAGNIRERYKLDELDWRDKTVFDFSSKSIESVSVEFPYEMNESYVLKKVKNKYGLFDFTDAGKSLNPGSEKSITKYLQNFEEIGAEDIQNHHPLRNEIIALKPYCIIKIKILEKEEPISYTFYPIEIDHQGKAHYEFNPGLFDNDFFRLHINRSDGDFLLVQSPNVMPILKKKSEF